MENFESNNLYEKSCGCIVLNEGKVLLVKHLKGHWGFPKGHMEKGETEIETAIREVKEETNIDVKINRNFKYEEQYITDELKLKKVTFFLAEKIGGELLKQEKEISEVKWVALEETLNLLTFDNSKKLFSQVLKDIKNINI